LIPSSPSSVNFSSKSNDICDFSNIRHSENIEGPSANKDSTDQLQTCTNSSPTSPKSTDFFSSGLKRQFSQLSPPLFNTDLSVLKKKYLPATSLPPMSTIGSPPKIDLDFSPVALPATNKSNADDSTLASFILEVRNRLDRLELALNEVTHLQAALAESESARRALEAQVASLSGVSPPIASSAPSAPPSGPVSAGKAQVSFAAVASKNVPKKRKKKTPPPPPRRAAATVARLFGPQTDISPGYQFVYYSTSVRRPLRELRRLLQAIGLNNSRILDIQYPVARVVSFLLHNDYVLEFTSAMHKNGRGGSPLVDFDPCDPVNLKDPKFASLPPDLRVQKAVEVENLRCLRALSFVRRPLRVSVARSFLERERINQAQFDAILAEELAARSSVSSPPVSRTDSSSDEEQLAKKQRLRYLSYLLHHDHETASLLAFAPSPVLSPSGGGEDVMTE
jgi:hypothetical protein